MTVGTATRKGLDGLPGRLAGLAPDSMPLWGRMTAHQMVCHLADSFRMALGERPVSIRSYPVVRTLARWVALRTPMRFPKGSPTAPELNQTSRGTRPVEFERDRAELLALMDRFVRAGADVAGNEHPLFGPMGARDWATWAVKHTDHHLRQFGL